MADTIKLRAGEKEGMPMLAEREVAYCTDENAFYIGTSEGNKKVVPGQMENLPKLESAATLEDVIAGYNTLVDTMISNGLMKKG